MSSFLGTCTERRECGNEHDIPASAIHEARELGKKDYETFRCYPNTEVHCPYTDAPRRIAWQMGYDSMRDLDLNKPDTVGPRADVVNHPSHYTSHPSGIECIQITEHMDFLLGNALKYIWRAGLKDDPIQDLKKAIFYIEREIALRSGK